MRLYLVKFPGVWVYGHALVWAENAIEALQMMRARPSLREEERGHPATNQDWEGAEVTEIGELFNGEKMAYIIDEGTY